MLKSGFTKYLFFAASLLLIASVVNVSANTNKSFLSQEFSMGFLSKPVLNIAKVNSEKGSAIVIYGSGFGQFEEISLSVEQFDERLGEDVPRAQWIAYADMNGNFISDWTFDSAVSTGGAYTLKAFAGKEATEIRFFAPDAIGVDFEQCANGPLSAPVNSDTSGANRGYGRGALVESKSHYKEGDFVPIRMVADGLTAGQSYTVTFAYDFTKGGDYANDYLGDYDYTESVNNNPCVNVPGCTLASEQTYPIPLDPDVAEGFDQTPGTADDITQIPGNFSIFGGTITNVTGYTLTGSTTSDSTKSFTVTFTANQSNVVIAYGSHISTRSDWGVENSAINIPGNAYHNFILDFPGSNQGNRDLQMDASAIIFPATVTIIKDARPNTTQAFNFSATGQVSQNFSLVDDGSSSNTTSFTGLQLFGNGNTITVTEAAPGGFYNLISIVCTSNPNGGNGTNNNTTSLASRSATIVLEEGESVTCTFTNAVTTAAGASVSGRVSDESGMALPRTTVTILNTASGATKSVVTNSFGRFKFDDLEVGDLYVITVRNKKYVFAQGTQSFVLSENLNDINFTATAP